MKSEPELADVVAFAASVTDVGANGLDFQHVSLCLRRGWFHRARLRYDHLDDRMSVGKSLHASSRPRDASVVGLTGLAPDRVDWDARTVFEAKGSGGAVEAVSKQTAFYGFMLWAAQGIPWRAVTDLIRSKRTREVPLTSDLLLALMRDLDVIRSLDRLPIPPKVEIIPLCKLCSFNGLCGRR